MWLTVSSGVPVIAQLEFRPFLSEKSFVSHSSFTPPESKLQSAPLHSIEKIDESRAALI